MRETEYKNFSKEMETAKKDAFRLKFFSLKDGSIMSLPVAVIGKGNGPVVMITSAMHGDEINGTYCCHMIYQKYKGDEINGKIVLLPIVNPLAFNQGTRISSIDYIDMNRSFSSMKKRKPVENLAGLLFENVILKANFIIDIHSAGPARYLPLVITMSDQSFMEAEHLNMGTIIQIPPTGPYLLPNCEKKGISGVCIEMGRALKLNREYCNQFVKGFENFLIYKGLLKGDLQTKEGQRKLKGKVVLPAETSGFFQSCVTAGQEVTEGQIIGKIETLFQEEPLEITSPVSGVIVYERVEDIIGAGESIFHIGY